MEDLERSPRRDQGRGPEADLEKRRTAERTWRRREPSAGSGKGPMSSSGEWHKGRIWEGIQGPSRGSREGPANHDPLPFLGRRRN